jgi:hypothetical protein
MLTVSVTTDLAVLFPDLKARLEISEGIVLATKINRYTFRVHRGKAFRWAEGPLDALIETIKEMLGYTEPEIESPTHP